MHKSTLFLILLLAGALVAAVSLTVHYRALYQDALTQWAGAEALRQQRSAETPVEVRPVTPVAAMGPREATESAGAPDRVTPLRDRISELETQLAERDTRIATLVQVSTNRSSGRAMDRRDRFLSTETLRTNNPALYAEMDRRRQEAQTSMQNALARQAEFVLKQDTSNLSNEEKGQHEDLVRLLDETWKITQQMQTVASRDERRELMHAMGENMRALDPLLLSERNRQFYSLGLSVGYSPQEATQFAAYLNDVIGLTSSRTLFPGFRSSTPRGNRTDNAPR